MDYQLINGDAIRMFFDGQAGNDPIIIQRWSVLFRPDTLTSQLYGLEKLTLLSYCFMTISASRTIYLDWMPRMLGIQV